MELTIIKETPHYVVCVKPRGIESQSAMPALLAQQLQTAPFYPVHRLDKETGGVMVYARNEKTAAFLSRQIQERTMEKTYLAVVRGCPENPCGQWEDWLFRDSKRNKSYLVKRQRKGVKKAILFYETLATGEWQGQMVSLIKIGLKTGRTHQIRVQFSGRNMPLVGDRRYGGPEGPALALWSAWLTFADESGQRQTFHAPLPEEKVWWLFEGK